MVERYEKVTKVTAPAESQAVESQEVREVSAVHTDGSTLVARIIWYVAGVLLVLLAFRFALAALGANPGNGFANFIYSTSHPFVAPFFSLFNYNLNAGVAHFELYTLIAMAVYALIAYGLARLATINQPHHTAA